MLKSGQVVGKYRLLKELGVGGMGTVWEAEHVELSKHVAIKVLRAEQTGNRDSVLRFAREAQTASRIGHPNIIDVYDTGTSEDGDLYLVMERLRGLSMGEYLDRSSTFPIPMAAYILCQVLSALDAAHRVGIVHRDLKPDNIFLADEGKAFPSIKLLDFGISKLADPTGTALTHTGDTLGTPYYMSPEQAEGERTVDYRADLWAIGVVLYEALLGTRPFTGTHVLVVLRRILDEGFKAPRELRPDLPLALESLISKALEKDPNLRCQSAREMFSALLPFVDEGGRLFLVYPPDDLCAATAPSTPIIPKTMAWQSGLSAPSPSTTAPVALSMEGAHKKDSGSKRKIAGLALGVLSLAVLATIGIVMNLSSEGDGDSDISAQPDPRTSQRVAEELRRRLEGQQELASQRNAPNQQQSLSAMPQILPVSVIANGVLRELTPRYVATLNASSVLQSERNPGRYAPMKMVDGLSSTAWGAERGRAIDEWFEVVFSRDVAVTSIEMMTGFNTAMRGRDLFSLNRRIKRARFQIGPFSLDHDYSDLSGWQTLRLDRPIPGRALKVTVLDFYEGSEWTDLHVSEIKILGMAAEP